MRKEVQSISSEKIQLEVKLKYELRTNHQESANRLSSLQREAATTMRGTTSQAAERSSSSALKDQNMDEDEDDFIPFGTFQPRFNSFKYIFF